MAKNSIEAIITDVSAAMIYLQAIQSSKLKQDNQRLSESIEELLADILVQAQIVERHLIDREQTIEKLQQGIVGIEDDLNAEEYEMKERSTPRNKTGRVASQSSKTFYPPLDIESSKETSFDVEEEIFKKESTIKP